ncbi:MAG: low molecular weight phosphotyrosine protein phosphatase, partial [Leptospiraceae bacterium]|nr:low molecular weight phosphotyrosine protein phosphatase [Leptospiraceae bacterium]
MKRIGVLFVCLGNICRSPAAEGAFTHLVKEKELESFFKIDSCGTAGYHIG